MVDVAIAQHGLGPTRPGAAVRPRCLVKACPVRYRAGDYRLCAEHRHEAAMLNVAAGAAAELMAAPGGNQPRATPVDHPSESSAEVIGCAPCSPL